MRPSPADTMNRSPAAADAHTWIRDLPLKYVLIRPFFRSGGINADEKSCQSSCISRESSPSEEAETMEDSLSNSSGDILPSLYFFRRCFIPYISAKGGSITYENVLFRIFFAEQHEKPRQSYMDSTRSSSALILFKAADSWFRTTCSPIESLAAISDADSPSCLLSMKISLCLGDSIAQA